MSEERVVLVQNECVPEFHFDVHPPLSKGSYKVGLSQAIVPLTWDNVDDRNRYFLYYPGGDDKVTKDSEFILASIPRGRYSQIQDVVKAVNEAIREEHRKNIMIEYLPHIRKCKVLLSKNAAISFCGDLLEWTTQVENGGGWELGDMLGFSPRLFIDQVAEADFEAVLDSVETIFVYADIVTPSRLGNVVAPLLCLLPIKERGNGILNANLESPYFFDVARNDVRRICFKITDKTGRPIDFRGGHLFFKLLFRRNE
jgi:hypothetical protein